jgi:NitT/TauT family transport system permease protein
MAVDHRADDDRLTHDRAARDHGATATRDADDAMSGLDALALASGPGVSRTTVVWAAVWPKVAAVTIALLLWQAVVWSGWRPPYALPGPGAVFGELGRLVGEADFWHSIATTMRRAAVGFVAATVIGLVVGVATARVRPLRVAIGSLITGLQTMPSIAWFPLAILLFQLSEQAMYFVVILGAAPSIANGVIGGVDYVPPLLRNVGRNLGASGFALYRHVIMPASLPSIVGGLKQGWAFAWRSLMAGELLVIIAATPSIGAKLDTARQLNQAESLLAWMVVILLLGILVDMIFGRANTAIRRRWGMLDNV